MIILIIVCGFILSAVISGIYGYIKNPKPPKFKTYREYYNYYRDLDYTAAEDESETEEDNESTIYRIEKDIEFYNAQIAMLEDLERIIEKDIHNGNGSEKVNLSRLISLDKQIHAAQKKVEKLNNELESLV